MAVAAVLVTYIGAIGYFVSDAGLQHSEWQDISNVSDIYGPGAFLSWLLAVASLHYDCYHYRPPINKSSSGLLRFLDIAKLLGLVVYSSYAVLHYVHLTLHKRFGPSHAAARYVGDKVFESVALIYFLRSWKGFAVWLNVGTPVDEQADRNDFTSWPALTLASLWGLIRALEWGLDVYDIPLKHPQYSTTWACLPPWSRPLSFPIGMLAGIALSEGDIRQRIENGFGKGFYIAFAVLHSGLFGTWGSLRMTDKKLSESGQYVPLMSTVLTLLCQYHKDLIDLFMATPNRAQNVRLFLTRRNVTVNFVLRQ